jgi:hypothetical protein
MALCYLSQMDQAKLIEVRRVKVLLVCGGCAPSSGVIQEVL